MHLVFDELGESCLQCTKLLLKGENCDTTVTLLAMLQHTAEACNNVPNAANSEPNPHKQSRISQIIAIDRLSIQSGGKDKKVPEEEDEEEN